MESSLDMPAKGGVRIRSLLLAVLTALASVIAALVVSSWLRLSSHEASLVTVYENRILPIRQIKSVSDAYHAAIGDSVAELKDGLISREEAASRVANARTEIEHNWGLFLQSRLTEQESTQIGIAEQLKSVADAAVERLTGLLSADSEAGLVHLARGELRDSIDALSAQLDRLAQLQIDIVSAELDKARRSTSQSRVLFVILSVAAVLVVAAGAWIAIFRVSRPLERVTGDLRRLTAGRGVASTRSGRLDEIEGLSSAVDAFRQSLEETERLEARKKLEDERLRRLLENLPIGVTLYDDQQMVSYRNAEAQRLLPVKNPESVIGMTIADLAREGIVGSGITDPGKLDELVAYAVERYRSSNEGRFELQLGQDRFCSLQFRWIDKRLLITASDITQLRAAQAMTADSETRLKLAVEALPLSFSLFSSDQRLLLFNDEFKREFSPMADEIRIGASQHDLWDAQIRLTEKRPQSVREEEWRRAKTDGELRAELIRRAYQNYFSKAEEARDQSDGSHTWRLRRLWLPNGDTMRISLDITDLRKKETEIIELSQRALAQRTSLLRQVLDAVPDAIAVLDQDLKISFVNLAMAEAAGSTVKEVPGTGLLTLQRRLGLDAAVIGDLLLTEGGTGTIEIASADGRPLKMSISQVATGEKLFAVADLSEQRRREADRLEYQKRLAHADKSQALVTLAGSIAHDFNNLLGVIDGFAALAHEDANSLASAGDNPLAREIVSALDRVLHSAERARQIVRSLNTLGKERELPMEEVDLAKTVRDCGELLRVLVPTSVKLDFQIPATPCRAICNPVQIEQIVTNLVINGVHAMEGRAGSIFIRLETIHLDGGRAEGLKSTEVAVKRSGYHVEPAGDGSASLFSGVLEAASYIRLTVADRGGGMSQETLRKVMNPFFTTKETGQGTGLGLSSVLEIVTGLQGGLHIRSHPGTGTAVMILLPEPGSVAVRDVPRVSEIDVAAEPEAVDRGLGDHGLGERGGDDGIRTEARILVVDDEQMMLDLATRLLAGFGHIVEGCSDPRTALERLANDPHGYDLVITDHTMPNMTGSELVDQVARIRPDLRFIMVTASASVLDKPDRLPRQVAQLIAKPYKADVLEKAVRGVLAEV